MKKNLLISLLLPLGLFAQKITVNEIDKITKQRRIETSTVKLKVAYDGLFKAYYRLVDTSAFIIVEGANLGAGVIGDKEKLLFLLDNDSVIAAYSTGVQSYKVTAASDTYHQQYRLDVYTLRRLAVHRVISIRKYNIKDYVDIEIPVKVRGKFLKLSQLFLNEWGLPGLGGFY